MSVQDQAERPSVDLPNHGDLAFGALMDALAPEPESKGGAVSGGTGPADGGPGAVPAGTAAPAGGAGGNQAPASGQPVQGTDVGTPATGGGDAKTGQPASEVPQGAGGATPGGSEQPAAVGTGADIPADWTADAATFVPKFGELSTKLEENLTKAFQQQAYEQAREEYGNYFDALEKHPRLLVGTQVPAIGKEGMETLRNSEDAKEWQEAVKSLLVAEIREGATAKLEESRDFLETVHASIDLFKNNKDLIPGTKGFDRQLADSFAKMAQPYEVRVEGKLQGYSIPVQPIIDSLRTQLQAQRQVAPTSGATTTPPAAPTPPVPGRQAEPPQAGIQSKAGSNTEKEDFSVLFGTIGLPNLQI